MPHINKLDLAYLAGIWDGEGCITVWRSKRPNGVDRYTCSIVLVNTNKTLIDNAERILGLVDVYPKIYHRTWKGNQKDNYQLTSRNLDECEKVIKSLYPYLVSKKPQANLALKFIKSRKLRLSKSKGWGHGTPYSKDEIKWSIEIQKMNRKGKQESSETKRQTL